MKLRAIFDIGGLTAREVAALLEVCSTTWPDAEMRMTGPDGAAASLPDGTRYMLEPSDCLLVFAP